VRRKPRLSASRRILNRDEVEHSGVSGEEEPRVTCPKGASPEVRERKLGESSVRVALWFSSLRPGVIAGP